MENLSIRKLLSKTNFATLAFYKFQAFGEHLQYLLTNEKNIILLIYKLTKNNIKENKGESKCQAISCNFANRFQNPNELTSEKKTQHNTSASFDNYSQ